MEGEIVAITTEAAFEHGLQPQARKHVFASSRKGHGELLVDSGWQIHESSPDHICKARAFWQVLRLSVSPL